MEIDRSRILAFLDSAVSAQIPAAAREWLHTQQQAVREESGKKALYRAISLAARKLGKTDLSFTDEALRQATEVRACVQDVADDLVEKVNHPVLSALHNDTPTRIAGTTDYQRPAG